MRENVESVRIFSHKVFQTGKPLIEMCALAPQRGQTNRFGYQGPAEAFIPSYSGISCMIRFDGAVLMPSSINSGEANLAAISTRF